MLTDLAGRIDAVGQLHKMLSQDPTGVADISEHLAEMCATLKPFILAAGPVQLVCDIMPGCVVRPEQVMPIATIVIEMVMNAIKYAHPAGVPGRIDIGCYMEDGAVMIEVCDDGVGLPENFDTHCDGSTGFNIVRTLATQLGATPVFDSDSLGLRFLLVLPKQS
jgi:two-component sensor histidine kinase